MSHNPNLASTSRTGVFTYNSSTINLSGNVLSATSSAQKTWALIGTNTISSSVASSSFTSISSTYKELLFVWANVTPDVALATVNVEFSSNNLSTTLPVSWQNNRYCGYSTPMALGSGRTNTNKRAGFIHIYNRLPFIVMDGYFGCYQGSSTNGLHYGLISGQITTVSTINSIRLSLSGANMTAGTLYIYGSN